MASHAMSFLVQEFDETKVFLIHAELLLAGLEPTPNCAIDCCHAVSPTLNFKTSCCNGLSVQSPTFEIAPINCCIVEMLTSNCVINC